MLVELGLEPTVTSVARLYAPIASVLVIDHADAHLAQEVERIGMRCVVTDTVMSSHERTSALAAACVDAVTG